MEQMEQIEYRQVLAADGGLVRYQQSLGREHGNVAIERVVASVDIVDPSGLKTIYSPTHAVAIERIDEDEAQLTLDALRSALDQGLTPE